MKKYENYDYVICGAGLFGCTCANLLANKGYKILILEATNHIGGACREEVYKGIQIHKYGPHVFHTSNKIVWDFVNKYGCFEPFELNVLAKGANGSTYNLPFNMNTFEQIFDIKYPDEKLVHSLIEREKEDYFKGNVTTANLEEQAISLVGTSLYNTLIKHYSEKQWGKECAELSPEIIKRLPLRFNYNNNYFNDKYQGVPKNYNTMFANMISHPNIDILFNQQVNISAFYNCDDNVIYSGAVDAFCNYIFGNLEYRTVTFVHTLYHTKQHQQTPIMNDCTDKTYNTRKIEHKLFHLSNKPLQDLNETVVSIEFPVKYDKNDKTLKPFYPIDNVRNNDLYDKYVNYIHTKNPNIHLGGRLGSYKYLDMDKTILAAMDLVEKL